MLAVGVGGLIVAFLFYGGLAALVLYLVKRLFF